MSIKWNGSEKKQSKDLMKEMYEVSKGDAIVMMYLLRKKGFKIKNKENSEASKAFLEIIELCNKEKFEEAEKIAIKYGLRR